MNTTIICDPLAGLRISWNFNVTLESITFSRLWYSMFCTEIIYTFIIDTSDFHFQAALSIIRSHNVKLRDLKAHSSNGTGLLLIDVSGNLKF